MEANETTVPAWKCLRCGYTWTKQDELNQPKRCAGCNSPYWAKPVERHAISARMREALRKVE